ncbi:unnamed protein product [Periconia digitata]|uniref:Uncharacterized protein n=1 Tax=Periconia digitata TaxID=1303443 RepID=A0A9W4XG05_9PLEO|nr:unnamed protein product [Periconia digitata]
MLLTHTLHALCTARHTQPNPPTNPLPYGICMHLLYTIPSSNTHTQYTQHYIRPYNHAIQIQIQPRPYRSPSSVYHVRCKFPVHSFARAV